MGHIIINISIMPAEISVVIWNETVFLDVITIA
jgi:hypothetical protein